MSAAVLLLLNNASRNAAAQRSITPVPSGLVAPRPESERTTLSDLRGGGSPRFDNMTQSDKQLRVLATKLIDAIAKERNGSLASHLLSDIHSAALAETKDSLTPLVDVERKLIQLAIGQLIKPGRVSECPKSLFIAADALWDRASQIGLDLHPSWGRQFRQTLKKSLGTAMHGDYGSENSLHRALYFLKEGCDLFTKLEERGWFARKTASIARAIGGTPAFSVADALLPK